MMDTLEQLLVYSEMRTRWLRNSLRAAEVPIEYAVSLPLPTRRWGPPAYAFFASATDRHPDQPWRQDTPDRWWALAAKGGGLLVYALWRVLPFATGVDWGMVTLPAATPPVTDQLSMLARIEALMDEVVLAFFAGEPQPAAARRTLADLLVSYLPAAVLPQYRAIAPDFWTWLEA